MPRRPEIGNVQLYPNRPLRHSDKNGYVLRFYCPIRGQRIRRRLLAGDEGRYDRRSPNSVIRRVRMSWRR